jgi:hypothetical protein
MFRRYYESNSDSGQVIVVPDESVSGEPDVQQLIVDRINEVNAAADGITVGGGDSGVDTSDGSGEQGSTETDGQSAEDLILGRFKTNEDVITAYQHLEPEYTQTRQQMRELERQVQELQSQLEYAAIENEDQDTDFHFDAPFTNQPRNVEELEQLAAEYPDRAALFAIQNASRLPDELVQEVVNYWHTRNPAQATAYMLQQMMQGYVPQIEQRLAPHDTSRQEEIVQKAVNEAEKTIGPSYGDYHDRIVDTIEANPALLPQDVTDVQAMSQSIVNVYAMLVGMDQLQRGKQLASQGEPVPAPQAATTQTRATAGPNVPSNTGNVAQEDIDAARQIQQLILNAQT